MKPKRQTALAPGKAPSPRERTQLFRTLLMILAPVALICGLEVVLRVCGFGYPTDFLLSTTAQGEKVWMQNDKFGWRFFGRQLARQPYPLRISREPAQATMRVFVFGESAAYGDPQPEFGLPRMLQAVLETRYPTCKVEVINAAMTAINSHAILPIAKDCAKAQGAVWVIYMGNNEVVGPFGAGTIFGRKAPPLGLVRATLALKRTRIGQALESLLASLHKAKATPQEWGGMRMFLENHVCQEDSRMPTVYRNFQQNVRSILEAARKCGAKVVLCTVGSNLRDCPPFSSEHRSGLEDSERHDWEQFYSQAVRAWEAGQLQLCLDLLSKAAAIDPRYAELQYRLAHCYLAMGNKATARERFRMALDQDALRFRADSTLNDKIREAARGREDFVRLVDAVELFNGQNPDGIPGSDFFYDHVHLRFEGNYLLARAIAGRVGEWWPIPQIGGSGGLAFPSAEACAARLAFTDSHRHSAALAMLGRLSEPPSLDSLIATGTCERSKRTWSVFVRLTRRKEQSERMQPAEPPFHCIGRIGSCCRCKRRPWGKRATPVALSRRGRTCSNASRGS